MARALWAAGLIVLTSFCSQAQSTDAPPKDDPVIAEVLGEKIRMSQKNQFQGIIVGKLFEQYATEHKLAPTQDEIDAFVTGSRQLDAQQRKEDERQRAETVKKLESGTLSGSEQERLKARLKTLDAILKPSPELEQMKEKNPSGYKRMEENAAKQMIQAWKINQSLFRQYGGRVIYQQVGPEPIDAYRNFLQEKEKQGAFKILDQSLEPSFWNYFVNERIHSFASDQNAKKAFDTPWRLQNEHPSLLKTISVWIGVSCIVWIAITWVPSLVQLSTGRATGVGIFIPRVLHRFSKPLQILLALLGIPLLVGLFGGCIWYFLRYR